MIHVTFTNEQQALCSEMDRFVRCQDTAHFLQSPRWQKVKPGWDWRGILIYEDGQILGAMSLLIRRLPLGFSLLYAPRGPIGNRSDPALLEECLSAAREVARKCRGILLYLDPDEDDENQSFRRAITDLGFWEQSSERFGNIQPQYVFRLDLTPGREAVFSRFASKTRYNIGLAGRKGVTVRAYSGILPPEVLDAFSGLMEETGRRDHFLVRDRDYFARLMEALGGDAQLYLAWLDGVPIAGTIGIFYGNKGWYLYGASSNAHRNAMPNYLLQWTMIQQALDRGCRIFDFRGVPGKLAEDDPLMGLYRFKKGFSGTYTRFTGLFIYPLRPRLCKLFLALQRWRSQ